MKLNKIITRTHAGLVSCCGVLALLAVAMLCPVNIDGANAEGEITREQEQDVRAYVQSVVSVSLKARMDIGIIPKSGGTFKAETAEVKVATNNITGYNVFLKMNGEGTSLKNTNATVPAEISAIANETAQDGFADNTWGYNFGTAAVDEATVYKPVPASDASANSIASSDKTATSDSYNLTFGTKINTELPAGEYANSVVLSVVANPMTVTSLTQLTVMQDMTADICAASAVGDKAQLTDIRDGNVYWVEKLLDNNCWMTQNLAINFKDFSDGQGMRAVTTNGGAGAVLTDANSNFTTTVDNSTPLKIWQGMKATEYTVPQKVATPSQTDTRSWNLGKYVLADPTDGTLCSAPSGGTDANDSVMTGGNLGGCKKVGFVDVSDETKWTPSYSATTSQWDGKDQLVAVHCDDGTNTSAGLTAEGACTSGQYDAHYLAGNYYQFNTATAGTGGSVANGNAPSSICPKGWQLPLSGSTYDGTSGSFYFLLNKYGLTSTVESADGKYNIAAPPLSFVRSGFMYIESGSIWHVGSAGRYWGASRAYHLRYEQTVYPSFSGYRWLAFPLRCRQS